ncbi:hypothetical protein PUN28_004292 [Cardiocondyla obscurior]|uniref:Uncharacterized protein n=1 Tax=Cardiocondyla obscurior TaxID=286306 RepID=A0AAW2GCJ5_9HYME
MFSLPQNIPYTFYFLHFPSIYSLSFSLLVYILPLSATFLPSTPSSSIPESLPLSPFSPPSSFSKSSLVTPRSNSCLFFQFLSLKLLPHHISRLLFLPRTSPNSSTIPLFRPHFPPVSPYHPRMPTRISFLFLRYGMRPVSSVTRSLTALAG